VNSFIRLSVDVSEQILNDLGLLNTEISHSKSSELHRNLAKMELTKRSGCQCVKSFDQFMSDINIYIAEVLWRKPKHSRLLM